MKVLKWIFLFLGAIIAIALVIAVFLPKSVSVSSSVEIEKPQSKVFHSIGMFSERQTWDPWVSQDSTTEVTINTKEGYVGSTYEWEGESIGSGKMEVAAINYPASITSYLWFNGRPDTSIVTWTLEETGENTKIIWGFSADAPYPMGRIFLNLMKGTLQDDFDRGLENLKAHLEEQEITLSTTSEISETSMPYRFAMAGKASGTMEEIIPQMERMYNESMEVIQAQGLTVAGAPFSYNTNYDRDAGTVTVYAGFPVTEKGKDMKNVTALEFPVLKALKAVHSGPWEELSISYGHMMEYVEANMIPVSWNSMEVYLNMQEDVNLPEELKTEIYMEIAE